LKIKAEAGQEVEVRDEEFDVLREEWNEYRLPDGEIVRVKTVVAKLFRALDDNGQPRVDAEGYPVVYARGGMLSVVTRKRLDPVSIWAVFTGLALLEKLAVSHIIAAVPQAPLLAYHLANLAH